MERRLLVPTSGHPARLPGQGQRRLPGQGPKLDAEGPGRGLRAGPPRQRPPWRPACAPARRRTHPEARARSRRGGRGPDPPPGGPATAAQTVPGGRGGAGEPRAARKKPRGAFPLLPAAREEGAECGRRRAGGRGGAGLGLGEGRAARRPAAAAPQLTSSADERYHWQREEDGGRAAAEEGAGYAERGYAQDAGVAATASASSRPGRPLRTTPSRLPRRPPYPRCSRRRPGPEGRSPCGDRAAAQDPAAIGVRRRRGGWSGVASRDRTVYRSGAAPRLRAARLPGFRGRGTARARAKATHSCSFSVVVTAKASCLM